MTVVLLTSASGASWSRPDNWTDAGHTVNLLGAGGRGGTGLSGTTNYRSGPGGGAGAHVLLTRTAGSLGSSVNIRITSDNASLTDRTTTSATLWGATTFANTRYVESGEGGGAGGTDTAGGVGGSATTTSTGTPTVPTYTASQGNAGGTGGAVAAVAGSAAGGGGAGGPTGVGANGGPCVTASRGGGGGGGANNGTVGGGTSASATGANGGNGPGGTGGGAGSASGAGTAGTTNTGGGGGGGFFSGVASTNTSGGAGGDDDIWTQTSDSATEGPGGGGGGGGANSVNTAGPTTSGGNGANYGSGGGGAGGTRSATSTRTAGVGASGLIVITYTLSPLSVAGSFSGAGALTTNIKLGSFVDLHPDADDADGGWTTDTGGTSLFAAIDEATSPNDSDYIQSTDDPAVDICRVRLTDPTGTLLAPVTVRIRTKADGAFIDLTTRLKEGSTIIAEWTDENLSTTFTTIEHELLQVEIDAIGDPTNLFIEFESNLSAEAETIAWVAAVVTNGGTVSDARASLVNDLIIGLKADSVWSKLDRLWLFAGENSPSALTDIVSTSLAVGVGSPTFTTDRGFSGLAVAIDSNFNPSTAASPKYTQDSASIFAWNDVTAIDGILVGNSLVSNRINTIGGGSTGYAINSSGSSTLAGATTLLGFYHVNRSASSALQLYINGSSAHTDTVTSTTLINEDIGFLARVTLNSPLDGGEVSCGGMGESLNGTEALALYDRLRTYMTAVGVP